MPSPSRPLKVALIGAGLFPTKAYLPTLAKIQSIISLRGVYSRSLKSASTFAEIAKEVLALSSPLPVYHDQGGPDGDLNALLSSPDIDAVMIALPITLQPDVIKRAWEHGKHVLSEKPIAPSVAEGISLIKEYEGKYKEKLIWRVAENEEASTANRELGKLIKSGEIGKVAWWNLNAVGSISKDSPWYNTPWRTVPEYQGGFLLDGGVHSAAVLRIVLPSEPESLSAYVSLNLEHLDPVDTMTALVHSSDGCHGLFERSEGGPDDSRKAASFTITGDLGWIDYRQADGLKKVTIHKKKEGVKILEFELDDIQRELEFWAYAIFGESTIEIGNPWETLKDVAFIEVGLNSKGEKIDLGKYIKEGGK